jgi:hypothetical protein
MSRNVVRQAMQIACAVVIFPLLVLPEPAQSGSRGQQLEIKSAAHDITVEGRNHSGNWAKWTGRSSMGATYRTTGWWWAGEVTITTFFPNGQRAQVCKVNVPVRQSSDWISTVCFERFPPLPR